MLNGEKQFGLGDFAFRIGISSGTLLVDLERRQPIDLLPNAYRFILLRGLTSAKLINFSRTLNFPSPKQTIILKTGRFKSNSSNSRQSKMMPNRWLMQTYQIKQHVAGNIVTETVSGQVCSGFGIHQTAFGWHITHLKTGWATFISGTREGAEIIAEYLIENYAAEFARLNIKGCQVENFRALAERIETDAELWNLRRIYVVPQRQLNYLEKERQPPLQIIS